MIDWARLLRVIKGQEEPKQVVVEIVKVPVACTPTMESLRSCVASLGQGKSDAEQCGLWYDIEKMAFKELGEVYVNTTGVTFEEIRNTICVQYPAIQDLKQSDTSYMVTDPSGMLKILSRDWTNMVPYISDSSDCDKYANRLYEHCCRYYGINTVFPVWGNTTGGYHAFNCAVLKDGDGLIARLIEPQGDVIFINQGPLGEYTPSTASQVLGSLGNFVFEKGGK